MLFAKQGKCLFSQENTFHQTVKMFKIDSIWKKTLLLASRWKIPRKEDFNLVSKNISAEAVPSTQLPVNPTWQRRLFLMQSLFLVKLANEDDISGTLISEHQQNWCRGRTRREPQEKVSLYSENSNILGKIILLCQLFIFLQEHEMPLCINMRGGF